MKKQNKPSENYILLPIYQTRINQQENPKVARFFTKLSAYARAPAPVKLHIRKKDPLPADGIAVRVLDSIDTEGAKLVNIKKDELPDFRFSYPGLRIFPEKFYRPAVAAREFIRARVKPAQAILAVTFVISNKANQPIAGVTVVVFSDFKAGRGASGTTDHQGRVVLKLGTAIAERIYVYPEHSYWSKFQKNVTLGEEARIQLDSIGMRQTDCLRYFYPTASWPPLAAKVRIGIIDTGTGPHQDLPVSGGKNLVRGEDEEDYHDNGEGHGTHVGGIIAAAGSISGVAAGAEIMSYRVFPKGEGASNFDIMKAIDQAIRDKCDLINMSLGETQDDEAISSYVKEAYQAGILCFAANGNDDRGPVSFPAAYSLAIAVSAMGRKQTSPPATAEEVTIQEPYGTDRNNFIAGFSNVGIETDLTAPGVGIISTFPGNRYAVMDGTSMACPAAAGMAARILCSKPELLNLPRNESRAEEMVKFLALYTKRLGFGANFEGKGMLQLHE